MLFVLVPDAEASVLVDFRGGITGTIASASVLEVDIVADAGKHGGSAANVVNACLWFDISLHCKIQIKN